MVKLLTGQPLYMSKHILAQRQGEVAPGTPFTPPPSFPAICLQTTDLNGNYLDVKGLTLHRDGSPYWNLPMVKIGLGAFITPPDFDAGALHTISCDTQLEQAPASWGLSTYNQLRKLHYLELFPMLMIAGVGPNVPPSTYAPWFPLLPSCTLAFNNYFFNLTNEYGTWKLTGAWQYDQDTFAFNMTFSDYECPVGKEIFADYLRSDGITDWYCCCHIWRDALGIYHTHIHDPL